MDDTQEAAHGGRHAAPPQPAVVVREALLEPVPCPSCGSDQPCRCIPDVAAKTDHLVARIVDRLNTHGLLHSPDPPESREVTEVDAEQAARWLAGQSRHPRYTQSDDGWRMLLEAEHNVEHAHASAVRAAQPATATHLTNLGAAKALLLGWVEGANRRGDEK